MRGASPPVLGLLLWISVLFSDFALRISCLRAQSPRMTPAPSSGASSSSPPTDLAHDVLRQERQPLDVIFSPRNVAVIGATETPSSVGRTLLWNLIQIGRAL